MAKSGILGRGLAVIMAASILVPFVSSAQGMRAPAEFGIGIIRPQAGERGAPIAAVSPGSVAERIGLKAGDVIVAMNAEPIAGTNAYIDAKRRYREGDTVTFTVRRDGTEMKFAATATAGRNVAATKEAVDGFIEQVAAAIEKRYVLPEVASRYAAALRGNLAKGAYYNLPDEIAFADKVTEDLRATFEDRHLHMAPNYLSRANLTRSGVVPEPIGKLARLTPDIAYMRFGRAPDDEAVQQQVIDFMKANADAKTFILDLRTASIGGVPTLPYRILPYFFAETTPIQWVDFRKNMYDEFVAADQPPTMPGDTRVAGPAGYVRFLRSVTPSTDETRLHNAKVHVLTSAVTGSAWELLAFAFLTTKRSTVIGERTAGRGNPSRWAPIGENFRILIPSGRILDPRTGTGWEGTGIEPSVRVPAGQALTEALVRSGLDRATASKLSASLTPNPADMEPA